ncbi:arylsulfatase E [Bacteroides caccae CL03T12C61]|uniref:Arylsulfatase E n=1 Tax=Bacteroides caccae CL03T12C61 TaxID=997873 RepID=I9PNP5_9BACE|nr:arylsulfatase E [Bacteroides caccae CL03T12C61]
MKKSRRTYNGVHLNKKSNTQDVVEQSLTIYLSLLDIQPEQSGNGIWD